MFGWAYDGAGSGRRLSAPAFYGVALLLAFLAYFLVFAAKGPGGWPAHALASLINLVPLVLLAPVVHIVTVRLMAMGQPLVQLAAHLALAPLFSLLWYWLMMVLIGLSAADSPTRFDVRPFFSDGATAWQLLQGATIYALIAALACVRARHSLPDFVVAGPSDGAPKGGTLSRYFIRQGDDLVPIDVAEIVSIAGADDYAEVATMAGRHLVRMTLAEFEEALDGEGFIRIHRSRIVNLARIARAEPAGGGRLLLHMEDGEAVPASRAGAKLLRDRLL